LTVAVSCAEPDRHRAVNHNFRAALHARRRRAVATATATNERARASPKAFGELPAVALTCPSEPSMEESVLPDATARWRLDYLPSGGLLGVQVPASTVT
jgi:hypothetical protein